MHLRLIKGLSYDGVVRASVAHPDVFVDDPRNMPHCWKAVISRLS